MANGVLLSVGLVFVALSFFAERVEVWGILMLLWGIFTVGGIVCDD